MGPTRSSSGIARYEFRAEGDLIGLWWICQKVHGILHRCLPSPEWRAADLDATSITRITALDLDGGRFGLSIRYGDQRCLTVLWEVEAPGDGVSLAVIGNEGMEIHMLTLSDTLSDLLALNAFEARTSEALH